jgi:hypothetical protein
MALSSFQQKIEYFPIRLFRRFDHQNKHRGAKTAPGGVEAPFQQLKNREEIEEIAMPPLLGSGLFNSTIDYYS